jgi:hypothetical protein
MLAGLDDVEWADLSHFRGSAVDTPDLLRQLASEDAGEAWDALGELAERILMYGEVYPATIAAIPFLAEIARSAPHHRHEALWMLGTMVDPGHVESSPPEAQAALAGQTQVFVELLDDGDARVREAAAYAAAQAGVAPAALWSRWQVEDDPAARASLALALGLLDPVDAEPVLIDVVVHGPPAVRVAAAMALRRAGRDCPDGTGAAVASAIDEGATIPYGWAYNSNWFHELLMVPAAVATDLFSHTMRSRKPETVETALLAMRQRCEEQRSAPAIFVPLLAPLLRSKSGRWDVMYALRSMGVAAAQFADVIAGWAARFPKVAGEPRITTEYMAVQTLMRLGDPRWIDPFRAGVSAVSGHIPEPSGARFNPASLAAVRSRLAREPASVNVLGSVLASWGVDAAPAVPELLAAIPRAGRAAAWALMKIGHDDAVALPHLREIVAHGDAEAAAAIRRLTGDAQPLLDLLLAALTEGEASWPSSLPALDGLADVIGPLLPTARKYLRGAAFATAPGRKRQLLAARVVAVVEPAAVLPTVRAILAEDRYQARAAANLIADLAQADRRVVADFEPDLRQRLGDPHSRLAAARALARLGVPTEDLATALVAGITDPDEPDGVDTILELRATETIPALEELLASDERFVTGTDHVWTDEMLQERMRAAIVELRTYSTDSSAAVRVRKSST